MNTVSATKTKFRGITVIEHGPRADAAAWHQVTEVQCNHDGNKRDYFEICPGVLFMCCSFCAAHLREQAMKQVAKIFPCLPTPAPRE